MTYLLNDPAAFADEAVDGFVAANAELVIRVNGGVVRATETPDGQVAVLTGGGSGHYPAFAGLVGPGLAHGAVLGNVFAAPSAQQARSVARSVQADGGVLLCYGNYAGDVLNFDQAERLLRADGVPCRTVVVTDDISSSRPGAEARRRGIAGGLIVLKAACWAAEQGRSLDEVWALADRANRRTRTLGVAFSGCTLPGAASPLFTVPEGRMAVGMGIHGEPGISESEVPTAEELAELLVASLLTERPEPVSETGRVALVLNGLGAIKHEELFVLYRAVATRLGGAGITIVDPEVGEFFTSFEMAGASLSLCWLDPELEAAWRAPAEAPGYRKGSAGSRGPRRAHPVETATRSSIVPTSSEASRAIVPAVLEALEALKAELDASEEELGRLDAIAGDGDHGIGMRRGAGAALDAARAAADARAGAGSTIRAAGEAWADRAGGTSGALWGLILGAVGESVGDELPPDASRVATGFTLAESRVVAYGGAARGDKTLLDVLGPFADALAASAQAGRGLPESWIAAADVATTAAASTAGLLPRAGRARPHAERSAGHPDPGAVSMARIVAEIARRLEERNG